ncbi:MAG: hypothetical protein MK135_10820 [Polyangiaceae bacterium]|nr:hypothetical protein [Polyangiaceae bacterium]
MLFVSFPISGCGTTMGSSTALSRPNRGTPSLSEAGGAAPKRGFAPGVIKPFSEGELMRLRKGQLVRRWLKQSSTEGRAVGALSYQVLEGTPRDWLSQLVELDTLSVALPKVKLVEEVYGSPTERHIRILHQSGPFRGEYTVLMNWNLSQGIARFWMHPGYHADIQDLWGFFRVSEWEAGRSLISFGFFFRAPAGLGFLENSVRRSVSKAPQRLKSRRSP